MNREVLGLSRWLFYGLVAILILWPYLWMITADTPHTLFWLAIPLLLTALWGRIGPIIVATTACVLFLFTLPLWLPSLHWQQIIQPLLFLPLCAALLWLLNRELVTERQRRLTIEKEYKEALANQSQLQLLLESTPIPLSVSCFSDGTFLFTNSQFSQMFGYPPEALQHTNALMLFDNQEDIDIALHLFLEQDCLRDHEMVGRRADGTVFRVNVWVERLLYYGKQALFIGYQDVTEQKRVEAALQRSTERLALMQQIEQGIITAQSVEELASVTLRQIQQLIPCQRASLALFDYDAQTAWLFAVTTADMETADVGREVPLSGFSRRDSLMRGLPFIMADLLAEKELAPIERQRLEEEGIRSYVNIPLMYQGWAIGSLNLASRSVNPWTEEYINLASELAAQLAIVVSQSRLRETAERRANELEVLRQVGLEMITKLDLNTLLQLIVSRASELVDALVGNLYLKHPTLDAVYCVAVNNKDEGVPIGTTYLRGEGAAGLVFDTGEPLLIENYGTWSGRLPQFDGWRFTLLLVPVRWGEKMLGLLSVADGRLGSLTKDDQELLELFAAQAAIAIRNAQLLDEVQQTVRQLEQQNAELERFTYTVSHDLKSPLVTVRGFLGFVEKDIISGNNERALQDIVRIREATEKMDLLLRDLLELSRIGRLTNPPQTVAFNDLVQEALQLTAGQIGQQKVHVTVMPHMPQVIVDRPRLLEVLQNLLDNAVKYMGEQASPHIEIGYYQQASETVFYVRDNGVGIEARYHDKVFGLFERLHHHVEGTGIGLALVKRIVEVHNGRVWIESAGKGQGATFFFTLESLNDEGQKAH